jgi:hypothetical protein
MPYSCISKLSMEVKSMFFQLSNRKNVKVNIMPFRSLSSIEFQGSCSKNLNIRRSKIVSLESTVHRLSVNASYLHN